MAPRNKNVTSKMKAQGGTPKEQHNDIGKGEKSEVDAIVGKHEVTPLRLEQAEKALLQSEARYRTLFESIDEGFCVFDMLYDDAGRPVDLRYVEVNPAFERHTGLADAQGATIRELVPDIESYWFEIYGRVAASGEPIRFENRGEGLGRWFDVYAFRVGRPEDRRVAAIFADITARKQAELDMSNMRRSLEERVAERTDMLRLLNEVAVAANNADTLDEALQVVLRQICEHNGWLFGHAFQLAASDRLVPVEMYHEAAHGAFTAFRTATSRANIARGEGLPGRVLTTGKPQWTTDIAKDLTEARARIGRNLGLRTAAAFPIRSQAEVVGVLEFFSDKSIEPSDRLLETMESLGMLLGRVVERERFARDIAGALLNEQRRIGADLHDSIGQDLAGAALLLDRLSEKVKVGKLVKGDNIGEIGTILRRAIEEIRGAVRGLRAPASHQDGFEIELRELVESISERYEIDCIFECPEPLGMTVPETAAHFYRMVSEAVTNAAKHSRANQIAVSLKLCEEGLVAEVRDDGVGIAESERRSGSGLRIMRHRAKMIGAKLDVLRARGGGTVVSCTVPGALVIRPAERGDEADELNGDVEDPDRG
ncbi:MAG: GAF domain-containing protein [Phycisphaerae bacterium]|nr:GAF domain-containing protein [Phycisphaerae bacterium]